MIIGWSKHRTRECKLIRRNKESINTQQIHMLVCCCILENMVVVDSTSNKCRFSLNLVALFAFIFFLHFSFIVSIYFSVYDFVFSSFIFVYLFLFFSLSHIYCVYFFMHDVLSIWNMSIKPFVCKSVFVYTCVFSLYFLQIKIRRSVEQQCV